MRIAVVCTDLGVRVPGTKGASLHLASITTAFARAGHTVLLVGVAGHGDPPGGVEHLLLPHPGRSTGLRRELRKLVFIERLARVARPVLTRFAPDIVYERLSLFGTAGARLAAGAGALHAIEVNALLAEEEAHWRGGLRLARLARHREAAVLADAHLRVTVSDELRSRVADLSAGGRTEVVANGFEATAFASPPERGTARAALGLPHDRPVIGFAGSLRPWHGLDVAIDALPAMPGVLLAIAGEGEIRAHLERRAEAAHVGDRVRWLGPLPHGDIPTFLAGLDVALAPYPVLEQFAFSPLKLYEYLAAGVPVVASDVGQIRHLLDGGHAGGRLVTPGDPAALATAVRSVLDNPAAARASAGKARVEALRSHSWDARAAQLVDLFAEEAEHALAR